MKRDVSLICLDSHFKTVLSVTNGPGYALLPIELEEKRLKNYFKDVSSIVVPLHCNKYLAEMVKKKDVPAEAAQVQENSTSAPAESAVQAKFADAQIKHLADVLVKYTSSTRDKIRGYWQFAALGTVGVACLSAVALTLLYNWAYHEVARQFIGPAAQVTVAIGYVFAGGGGPTHFGGSSMPNLISDPIGGAIVLAGVVLMIAGGAIATLWIEAAKGRDKLIDDAIISITDHMVLQCGHIIRAPGSAERLM